MTFREALARIEGSRKFEDWRKENHKAYLSGIFTSIEEGQDLVWQLGYYDEAADRMTTFVDSEPLEMMPPAKVLKLEEKVKPLDLDKEIMLLDSAVAIAKRCYGENYPSEKVAKTLAILQNLEKGQLWNITFFTASFHTVNVKVDAATGKVIEHSRDLLFRT